MKTVNNPHTGLPDMVQDDISIGNANGLSVDGQEISLQLATDEQPGALSAEDHAEFSGKEPAIEPGDVTDYFRGDKQMVPLNQAAVSGLKTSDSPAFVAVVLGSAAAPPAADVGHRGLLWIVQGGAGAADTVQVCLKSAAGTYSWKTIATG